MSKKAEEMLKKARLKLSGAKYRFFGLCLYATRIKFFTNKDNAYEGYVRIDKNNGQFENVIYINSDIIDGDENYKAINMIDILLHEWNHIIRRHDIRRGDRDGQMWNVACDHVIDSHLAKLNLSRPFNCWNILKNVPAELKTEEDVYEWLINNSTVKIEKNTVADGEKSLTVTESDGNSFTVSLDINQQISPEQREATENYISQVRAIYNLEKERGEIGSETAETLEELLQVTIPWEQILEKAIKNRAFQKTSRRNWRTPNKILYSGSGRYLPGRISVNDNTGIGTLLVHIDSSGSVNNRSLKRAGHVIFSSAKYFNKIELIVADVDIHQQKTFLKNNFNEIESYFSREGIKGRGGTSHRVVFASWDEYIEKHLDEVSMMISITDLYSDVDDCIKNFKAVKFIPLTFIVEVNGGNINRHDNVSVIRMKD